METKIQNDNFRRCVMCGIPLRDGMTDGEGFYCCEGECFEKHMDETYGKHCWMSVNDDFEGGYYIVSSDVVGGYIGTGIFYTDWYDDEDWMEEVDKIEESQK